MRRVLSVVLVAAAIVAAVVVYLGVKGEYPWAAPTRKLVAITMTPFPWPTGCSPEFVAMAPCPGTPAPAIHRPLGPPGPIADRDVDNRLPGGLAPADRALVRKVMLARPAAQRQDVRWLRCDGQTLVYVASSPNSVGSFRSLVAVQILNDDPNPRNAGGDYVNIHNCYITAQMP